MKTLIKNILIIFIITALGCVNKPNVRLLDGSEINLEKGVSTFVFLNVDCPICRKYAGSWKMFQRDSLNICFVFPGDQDLNRIKKMMQYDSIPESKVALDPKYLLSKHLNATVTPQAIIIKNGLVRYSGKIDDRFENLGSSKPNSSVNYIQNALNSLKHNESIEVPITQPVGCLIERE